MVVKTEANYVPNKKAIQLLRRFMALKEVDNSLVDEA